MLPNLLKKNSPVIGLEVSLIRDIPARGFVFCPVIYLCRNFSVDFFKTTFEKSNVKENRKENLEEKIEKDK